ncbi:hypothetical protein [Sphingomonas asaccharolytica]|uniref:hypothetical protein n=1 Tax=Sphingomonas asaccharolytica TaxID=40681 RepID=UPI000A52A12E|nr:hypothetical protein [Sphingomonas asaccharolytica]
MKTSLAMVAALIASAPAMSAPAPQPVPQPAASPFFGQWKLDTASLPTSGDAAPASVTAEFADGGAGIWNTTYVITAKDGSARRMTSREPLDGKAVPITGDQTVADSVAMTNPSPDTLVMGLTKGGSLASVRVYTVSADGSEMIENATFVGDDGKPMVSRFRWIR